MNSVIRSGRLMAILLATSVSLTGQTTKSVSSVRSPQSPSQVSAQQQVGSGELVFRNHCNHCHSAPEQLNPRITGTVLRHMRVRANLSARDERALLDYLAP